MARKPYRSLTGFDQFGDEWDYKDLIKKSLTSEDAADNLASTASTIIYSIYSLPLTTKGDILTHDGTTAVRKGVGTNKTALVADSSTSDGLAWRTLNTTKGDLLGYDTDLKRVPIGTNYYALLANSGVALGLAWTALTTTKGDLLSHDGTTPLRRAVGDDDTILSSDSAQTTGLAWVTRNSINLGLGGDWIYGDGVDGDLVLAIGTSLANDDNLKMYSSIDLAGFNLSYSTSDFFIAVYCSGLCDGNGGDIHSRTRDNGTVGAGSNPASIPFGGNGGDGAGAVFVYARTMADVDCDSSGTVGVAGGDAQHPADAGPAGPAVGGTAAGNARWRGVNLTVTNPTGGQAAVMGAISAGGAAGSITAGNRIIVTRTGRSALELVLVPTNMGGSADDLEASTCSRAHHSPTGAGGASGGEKAAGASNSLSGGGGGGGGAGLVGNGGAGGAGVVGTASAGEISSAAGGGGGGGGSHVIVITNDSSGVTVSANGGNGGGGGIGGDLGSLSGNGGGGGAGVAVGIGPGLTVTATAGAPGTTGNGGSSGGAGRAYYRDRA